MSRGGRESKCDYFLRASCGVYCNNIAALCCHAVISGFHTGLTSYTQEIIEMNKGLLLASWRGKAQIVRMGQIGNSQGTEIRCWMCNKKLIFYFRLWNTYKRWHNEGSCWCCTRETDRERETAHLSLPLWLTCQLVGGQTHLGRGLFCCTGLFIIHLIWETDCRLNCTAVIKQQSVDANYSWRWKEKAARMREENNNKRHQRGSGRAEQRAAGISHTFTKALSLSHTHTVITHSHSVGWDGIMCVCVLGFCVILQNFTPLIKPYLFKYFLYWFIRKSSHSNCVCVWVCL